MKSEKECAMRETQPWASLANQKYLRLTTFKRDGTPVGTPVWFVQDAARLLVWTFPTAGKVKRLRNNPRVTLAPCTIRGVPRGAELDGRARLLPESARTLYWSLLARKYPLAGRAYRLYIAARRRMGRASPEIYLEIVPASSET